VWLTREEPLLDRGTIAARRVVRRVEGLFEVSTATWRSVG
jgi:hypothetical protein